MQFIKMNKLFNNPYKIGKHKICSEMPDRSMGIHRLYKFENGYGASVVRFGWKWLTTGEFHYGSYTDNENEWELGVIKWTGKNYKLDYSTPVTDDVIGHLLENEVEKILKEISELKK